MPFWDFLRKQEDVAVAVPLNYDVGQATYPDASFASFASEGYGKSEIVHACIRELAVSAASPRYYVQAPATGGGAVEITSGPTGSASSAATTAQRAISTRWAGQIIPSRERIFAIWPYRTLAATSMASALYKS